MWPHQGSWGTPDFGITEKIGSLLKKPTTSQGGSNVLGASKAQEPTNTGGGGFIGPTQPTKPGGGGTQPAAQKSSGGSSNGGGGGGDSLMQAVTDSGDSQRAAAEAQAEAARQRARSSYEVVQKAGGQAKDQAKGTYDWIIDTLGSNKQDLLTATTTNYDEQKQNYALQEKKTKDQYDEARFDIRSTYQELSQEQEKILRGAGMGNSSRSLEAKLRMNRLLGKDSAKLSTNEADALSLIGNAVSTLGKKYQDTKDSIEKEASSKMEQAQLQYKQQVDAIDLNMFRSEKDREDEYKAAEAQLSKDIAGINTWVGQSKIQISMQLAQLQTNLDNFVVDMTDVNGGLTRDLTSNQEVSQKFVSSINGGFKFDTVDIAAPKQAVYNGQAPSTDPNDPFAKDALTRSALFGGSPQEAGASASLKDPLSLAIS